MELTLTTPALLFPAIAILMLGYINRYLGCSTVIRSFKKDYDSGYTHNDLVKQLIVLRRRIELFRTMLTFAIAALIAACISMLLIFLSQQTVGVFAFAISLLMMVVSMILSIYETMLSNRSLMIEINDILTKENNKN